MLIYILEQLSKYLLKKISGNAQDSETGLHFKSFWDFTAALVFTILIHGPQMNR